MSTWNENYSFQRRKYGIQISFHQGAENVLYRPRSFSSLFQKSMQMWVLCHLYYINNAFLKVGSYQEIKSSKILMFQENFEAESIFKVHYSLLEFSLGLWEVKFWKEFLNKGTLIFSCIVCRGLHLKTQRCLKYNGDC